MITSTMSYVVQLHVGEASSQKISAPVTPNALPVAHRDSPMAAVLQFARGRTAAGLYVRSGLSWQKILPYSVLNEALLSPVTLSLYIDLKESVSVPEDSILYLNGGLCSQTEVPANDANFWVIVSPTNKALTPDPEPELTQRTVVMQLNFIQQDLPSLTNVGRMIVGEPFELLNPDYCKLVFEWGPRGAPISFRLSRAGETIITFLYEENDAPGRISEFYPTRFEVGDVLLFTNSKNGYGISSGTLMISNYKP